MTNLNEEKNKEEETCSCCGKKVSVDYGRYNITKTIFNCFDCIHLLK